jgi:outer membrane receptor protein involved in Fe transport
VFARVTNLADKRYASFGALAETQFDADGNFTGAGSEALFVAPGAPRAVTLGLRWKF